MLEQYQHLEGVKFDLHSPTRVCFGWGRRHELGSLVSASSSRAWILWGSRTVKASRFGSELMESLLRSGVELRELSTISQEPTTTDVDDSVQQLRHSGTTSKDCVVAIGGGSALDLGKAVAALALQPESAGIREYLEGVGTGRTLLPTSLPVIAVPTTAGTGSEATFNAVISSSDPPFKKSLRATWIRPQVALIDPELTVSNPFELSAHSGMDALTQLLESLISCRALPKTQTLCRAGLQQLPEALRTVCRTPDDQPARTRMAYAAHLSGVALAHSGLGIAHGLAAALGIHAGLSHGLACAMLLPLALKWNLSVAESHLRDVGLLWGAPHESTAAQFVIAEVDQLLEELQIPRTLSAVGVTPAQLPSIVRSSQGNSRSGNPLPLDDAQILEALEAMQ